MKLSNLPSYKSQVIGHYWKTTSDFFSIKYNSKDGNLLYSEISSFMENVKTSDCQIKASIYLHTQLKGQSCVMLCIFSNPIYGSHTTVKYTCFVMSICNFVLLRRKKKLPCYAHGFFILRIWVAPLQSPLMYNLVLFLTGEKLKTGTQLPSLFCTMVPNMLWVTLEITKVIK